MRHGFLKFSALLSIVCVASSYAQEHHWRNTYWLDVPVDTSAKPPEDDENRAIGKQIYMTKCYFCHGDAGDAKGRSNVERMDPRPRDFTSGKFKFKTVPGDKAPTDEDLYRTITRGVIGTAMPFWSFPGQTGGWERYKYLLTPKERWQVIYHIKTLSVKFEPGLQRGIANLENQIAEEKASKVKKKLEKKLKVFKKRLKNFDSALEKYPPLQIGPGPQVTPALIEEGQNLFAAVAECAKCHGVESRGDAMERKDDDWGFPIVAQNLTRAINFKEGNGIREIFRTISTGLNGSPMPSTIGMFSKDTSEDERQRWAIAAYVNQLSQTSHPDVDPSKTVLTAKNVQEDLPLDPNDEAWKSADIIDVPLTGQVMVKPRQWWPTINYVTVRALYNEKEVAIHLSWDDRTKSATPADPEKKTYPDAVHVQFPTRIPDSPEKPHFFLGDSGKPVNLWHFQADWQEDQSRKSPIEERTSSGSRRPAKPHAAESQLANGKGVFSNGQWKVVITRPLTTEDTKKDIQFVAGKLIPISFAVYDGSNEDTFTKGCISTWYYLVLETETPVTVYLWALGAVLFAGGIEIWMVKKAKESTSIG